MARRVGICLFDDVEVLDFAGPFEVFTLVRLADAAGRTWSSAFEVMLVGEKPGPIRAVGGMEVGTKRSFADCPGLDILVVPGGWGTRREAGNPVMLEWIRDRAREAELVTSVCTGSMLLASAGLLDGRRATTHWQSLDRMRDAYPRVIVERDQHVVEDGNVLTSAGISAGIDMALRAVARCVGDAAARSTAREMEYPFPDDNRRRVPL